MLSPVVLREVALRGARGVTILLHPLSEEFEWFFISILKSRLKLRSTEVDNLPQLGFRTEPNIKT
jgi:hypothetical protein